MGQKIYKSSGQKTREIKFINFTDLFWDILHLLQAIFVENIQKSFREIDLFDFTSFFGLDFLKFSGQL